MAESGRGNGRVTLRDVARAAGVSMMSVSNVVNGRFGAMSETTRARIEGAIEALGYRPHVGAQGLRRGRRFSLALLIVDRSPTYLAEPWMTDLVAGITNHLIGRNYGLYIQGVDARSLAKTSLLQHVATDGVCVLLSGPERTRLSILRRICDTRQPIVLFQEVLAEPVPDVCVVRQADRDGARALAELVLRRRPRRLAMLTTAWEWPSLRQRESGIRDALAAFAAETGSAAPPLDVVACGDGSFAATVSALGAYLDARGPPGAILAGSDPMGIAALRHLKSRGIRVPDEVEVTGFGAFDMRLYGDPVLTTMRSPAYEIGGTGAAALLARLETGAFAAREIVLPVSLEPGGSAGPASGTDAGDD